MKKLIDGLLYDTETATLIDEWEWPGLLYVGYKVYKTPNGRYFSVYSRALGEDVLLPGSPARTEQLLEDNERYDALEKHLAGSTSGPSPTCPEPTTTEARETQRPHRR